MMNEEESVAGVEGIENTRSTECVMQWAQFVGAFVEDTAMAILGFVPTGLGQLYDFLLKPLPGLGKLFQQRWLEITLKFLLGVTLGALLATTVSRLIFRPLGFILGVFVGSTGIKVPSCQSVRKVSQFFYCFSAQAVGGAILGVIVLGLLSFFNPHWDFTYLEYVVVMLAGAGLGLIYRGLMLLAIHTVKSSSAANICLNADRASKLSRALKFQAKVKIRDRVQQAASDIIFQMNGKELDLKDFFDHRLEKIAFGLDQKIDRHLNVLTDRAVYGDVKSFKRLMALQSEVVGDQFGLETFLDRVFNARAVRQVQDVADTTYDFWAHGVPTR